MTPISFSSSTHVGPRSSVTWHALYVCGFVSSSQFWEVGTLNHWSSRFMTNPPSQELVPPLPPKDFDTPQKDSTTTCTLPRDLYPPTSPQNPRKIEILDKPLPQWVCATKKGTTKMTLVLSHSTGVVKPHGITWAYLVFTIYSSSCFLDFRLSP